MFKPQRTGRIVVADQTPALVAFGEFSRVVGIRQAFEGAQVHTQGVLMDCDGAAQFVVLVLPMTASAIPMFERLAGLAHQAQAPTGIDAVSQQCRARQAVKRCLVRPGCGCIKPWVALSD
ncbi:hypothetical protein D3C81_1762440 [compost metagenome]